MKLIINQNQKKFLLENNDESLKNFLIKIGLDLTDKISIIESTYDIPPEFRIVAPREYIRRMLNLFGPIFVIDIDGEKILYQNRGHEEWFIGENGFIYNLYEIPSLKKFFSLGLEFSKIIDLFWDDDFY